MTEQQWIKQAVECINRGCELMTHEQVGQWEGVRGVLETAPGGPSEHEPLTRIIYAESTLNWFEADDLAHELWSRGVRLSNRPEYECRKCGRKFTLPAVLTGCCAYSNNHKLPPDFCDEDIYGAGKDATGCDV